jgi:hypothetical protein
VGGSLALHSFKVITHHGVARYLGCGATSYLPDTIGGSLSLLSFPAELKSDNFFYFPVMKGRLFLAE